MKIIYLMSIFFLISCNSIKVSDSGIDSTQDFVGNIKELKFTSTNYLNTKKDSVEADDYSVLYFNSKNNIIKQIDYYQKFREETIFNYKDNLLESKISTIGDRIKKFEYKYDSKQNLIEYKQTDNGKLYFIKTKVYDKKNNTIKQFHVFPNYNKNNSTSFYEYDYKNKVRMIKSLDSNNQIQNVYVKEKFDKNGLILRAELIYTDENKDYSSISVGKYDKSGNLINSKSIDKKGNIKAEAIYKYIFDSKGNIIQMVKYLDGKTIEKTISEITYR